jgi:predicted nicotinamide N-methyase
MIVLCFLFSTLLVTESFVLPPGTITRPQPASPAYFPSQCLGAGLTSTSGLASSTQLTLDDGEVIDVIRRSVTVRDDWTISVWEQHFPAETIEHYWNTQSGSAKIALDPFGLVNWPGSIVAAQELIKYQSDLQGATVLIVGAGTGAEAQAVAILGASKVIATDYNPTTLKLLEYGAAQAGLDSIISTQLFDLCGFDSLPECDIMIAADVMYSDRLSSVLGDRVREARQKSDPPKVLVTDSQKFADFMPRLRETLRDDSLCWEERLMESFTGSGVMVDEDQTYDVKARVLAIGWSS